MSRRWVVGLAVLVVAAAGCGSSAPSALRGRPEDVVRAAASRSLGSARVAVTVGADLAGQGIKSGDAAHLTFARTGAAAHLGQAYEVVAIGPSLWVRAGRWMTGTPGAVRTGSPLDTLLIRPGLGTDLALLRGAVRVLPYGGEEVRGTSTYRYSFLVDLAQAMAGSPEQDRPELQAALAAIGPIQWPADVWLDTRGRVRRLQLAEDPFAKTTTTRANLLFTQDGNYLALTNIEFYDYGVTAAISAPVTG